MAQTTLDSQVRAQGALGSTDSKQNARLEELPFVDVLTACMFKEGEKPAVAPDGRSVAYTIRPVGSGTEPRDPVSDEYLLTGVHWTVCGADIWLTDLNGATCRQLTADQGSNWLPTWSPDGRSLAFLSDRPEPGSDDRVARLWLWDTATDEQRLASDLNVRSQRIVWSPDSRRILVGVLPEGITPQAYAARAKAPDQTIDEPAQDGATVRIYQAKPRTDPNDHVAGVLDFDRWPMDLVWIDVATGEREPLVRNASISTFRLSPDGNHVVYSCPSRSEQVGQQQMLFTLSVVSGGQPSRVIAQDIQLWLDGGQFSWAPDSQKLAYRALGPLGDGAVYLLDLDGTDPSLITGGEHGDFTAYAAMSEIVPPFWDAASRNVYFAAGETLWRASTTTRAATEVASFAEQGFGLIEQREGLLLSRDGGDATVILTRHKRRSTCGFLRVGLADGTVSAIQVEHKSYDAGGVAVSADGRRLIYVAQDPGHCPDLHVLDLDAEGSAPRRLTANNPSLDAYVMGETRIVDWRTLDGAPGRGILLLPAGYEEGRTYPMITKVYGGSGPSAQGAGDFGLQRTAVDNLQLLATRGYAVFLPDTPLSAEKNEGTVISDLVTMVLPGVDKVVELGIADPQRLGLTGHSFGGYNTIAMITRTSRFQAAIMNAGLANLMGFYGEMAEDGTAYGNFVAEHTIFHLNGTLWQQRLHYLENSPIFHLDRVQTPLLIIHGGADGAVAPFLADEVFVGLRRLGKEVVYAKYQGEGHHQSSWSLPNQLDYWQRTVAFFDQHLKVSAAPESHDN